MTRTRPCVRKLLGSLLVPAVLIIAVASAQNIPVAKPEEVGMSSVRLLNIRKVLQAETDKGNYSRCRGDDQPEGQTDLFGGYRIPR